MLVLKEEEERDIDCFGGGAGGGFDCVEGPARAGGLTFHFVSSGV